MRIKVTFRDKGLVCLQTSNILKCRTAQGIKTYYGKDRERNGISDKELMKMRI